MAALMITIRTSMNVNKRRRNKNPSVWIESPLKIELDEVRNGSKVATQLGRGSPDPLDFEFSYDNPVYEDF